MQETWVRSLCWEDPLEKGMANPLQYSGLENPMDCIVHGVSKSLTQLSNFPFHPSLPDCLPFLLGFLLSSLPPILLPFLLSLFALGLLSVLEGSAGGSGVKNLPAMQEMQV